MHIDFTPEQKALRDELRAYYRRLFAAGDLRRRLDAEWDQLGGPAFREAMGRMGKDGWLVIGWPKEHGGQGRSHLEQFIFWDETWRARAPLPLITVNTVGPMLMQWGSEAQKADFLPKIRDGELLVSIGYTEPDGSPTGSTPLLIREACKRLVVREIPLLADTGRREDARQRYRIIQEKTREQSYTLDKLAHPGALADEPSPVLRPPQRALESRGGHLEHVARAHQGPGFQESLEGPADPRTVVGRHTLAGSAVRAVHPYLQDGALDRAGSSEIHQLETQGVEMVANRLEQRVNRHRSGKKMWGNSPTSHSRPVRAPPGQRRETTAVSPESQSKLARAPQLPECRGMRPCGRRHPGTRGDYKR